MFNPFRDIDAAIFSKKWWLMVCLRLGLSLAVMIGLTLIVFYANIPNPNMILIAGLVVLTSLYGLLIGAICGLEMIGYSMYFFSTNHSFFSFTQTNLYKLIVIIVGVILCVCFVGRLKTLQSRANRELYEANKLLRSDNLSLEEASLTDALTGVRNRYAFRKDAIDYVGTSLCLGILDIDDFKGINDTFGHVYGDSVLSKAGEALRGSFGIENTYRLGGDEFLVVSEKGEDDFLAKMEQAKAQVNAIAKLNQRTLFSAGYVYGNVASTEDLSLMIAQADSLLYQSKERGKDRMYGQRYDKEVALRLKKDSPAAI